MITLIVKVDIKPENFHDFIDATRIARDRTLNEERLSETYTINRDPDNENGVILVEIYYNQSAIDFHKTTEHFLEWKKTVEPYMNSPRQVTRYDSL